MGCGQGPPGSPTPNPYMGMMSFDSSAEGQSPQLTIANVRTTTGAAKGRVYVT